MNNHPYKIILIISALIYSLWSFSNIKQ